MKTSAVIRIVCWAVIALLLCCVLLWGLSRNGSPFRFGLFSIFGGSRGADFGQLTGEAGAYSSDNAYAVAPGSIKNIRVSWVSGGVSITPYDGDSIAFSESSLRPISENHALRYAVSNDTLTIHYSEPGTGWSRSWWNFSKKLEVRIPASLAHSLGELSVDAVSAEVALEGLSGERITLDTVSGGVEVANIAAQELILSSVSGGLQAHACEAAKVEADTTSGSVKLEGAFESVQADSISGAVKITSSVCPAKVRMDTVSGASVLAIPENEGFEARYDTVSGSFSCDFPATLADDRATYGNGGASFRFDSVSGSIRIEKLG